MLPYDSRPRLGLLVAVVLLPAALTAQTPEYPPQPLVAADVVFEGVDGTIAVEAEHFYQQTQTAVRAWYLNSPVHRPHVIEDQDDASFADAAGLAYVEALPDLFHTEHDPIIPGHSLGTVGGSVAVLHYNVWFEQPGTYFLWTRLRSNDEEDNTTQAGIDGTWPETAKTLQSPVNHKAWVWKNDNRFSRSPWKITRATLDVPTAGLHDVQFCMREDGEEFDRFVLTIDPGFQLADGFGPDVKVRTGTLPAPFRLDQSRPPAERRLTNPDGSVYGANVQYQLEDGLLAIEAEDFYFQSHTATRMWHLTSAQLTPGIGPDSDPPHLEGSSGGAYLELLPDARQKDEDARHSKPSICGVGGQAAVLHYMIAFPAAGEYRIWVRGRATDGDDNTLHVGLDNEWPESGKKLMFQGRPWSWSNTQRDTKAPITIQVAKEGTHDLQISMREDGCEIDRIVVSQSPEFVPADDAMLPTSIKRGIREAWPARRDERMSTSRVFPEQDGLLVVEIESVPASAGWQYLVDDTGHAGLGYLLWTPEGQGLKPGQGLLHYDVEITAPGVYQLCLRGKLADPANRPDTPDPDGNDIWLHIDGGENVSGRTPLAAEWTKLAVLGHPAGWTWNTHADVEKTHPDSPVCRRFEPGVYRLSLSGRSQGYAVDRLALVHVGDAPTVDLDGLAPRLDAAPESPTSFRPPH